MFHVIPTTRQDPVSVKKTKEKKEAVKQFVYGSSNRTGLLDFLVVITATFWYFFWTGLAIILKRDIPTKWLSIGYKIDGGKVIKNMKKAVLKDGKDKVSTIRVETPGEKAPNIDLLKQ